MFPRKASISSARWNKIRALQGTYLREVAFCRFPGLRGQVCALGTPSERALQHAWPSRCADPSSAAGLDQARQPTKCNARSAITPSVTSTYTPASPLLPAFVMTFFSSWAITWASSGVSAQSFGFPRVAGSKGQTSRCLPAAWPHICPPPATIPSSAGLSESMDFQHPAGAPGVSAELSLIPRIGFSWRRGKDWLSFSLVAHERDTLTKPSFLLSGDYLLLGPICELFEETQSFVLVENLEPLQPINRV